MFFKQKALSLVIFLLLLIAFVWTLLKNSEILSFKNTAQTYWIWGEIIFVDIAKKQIKVLHTDEYSLEDKEFLIQLDKNTRFINCRGVEELNPQDIISIDFVLQSAGKLLAKEISKE